MDYDKIIVELMSRIQHLEERVDALEKGKAPEGPKTTTTDIRHFILMKIKAAYNSGEKSITLKANDIHKEMNLKHRFPMVCNAMRQCMKEHDEVIYETASGYSSSLEIKYYTGS